MRTWSLQSAVFGGPLIIATVLLGAAHRVPGRLSIAASSSSPRIDANEKPVVFAIAPAFPSSSRPLALLYLREEQSWHPSPNHQTREQSSLQIRSEHHTESCCRHATANPSLYLHRVFNLTLYRAARGKTVPRNFPPFGKKRRRSSPPTQNGGGDPANRS